MANRHPQPSRHDLEAKIVKHCWEDEGFRKEFTADPKGAFVKYLEIPTANLPEITVHQEEPGTWHIVLPVKPSDTGALSEDELEKISGGTTPACVATVTLVMTPGTALISYTGYMVTKDNGGW
jgi:hypothetical protein